MIFDPVPRHAAKLPISEMLRIPRTITSTLRPVLVTVTRGKHTLPDLPYDFNALEPFISAEIMTLHHSKHHQTYVTNLNLFESKLNDAVEKNNVVAQIALQGALKFNGGGHVNHRYFQAPQARTK